MSNEHPDDRPRPTAPAWATVPTMPWQRVARPDADPDNPDDADEGDERGRPHGRPAGPTPAPPGAGRAAVPLQRGGQRPAHTPVPGAPHPGHHPGQPPSGQPHPAQAYQGPGQHPGGGQPPGQPGYPPRGQQPGRPPGPAPRQDPRVPGPRTPEGYPPDGRARDPRPHGQQPGYPPGPTQPGPYPPAGYPTPQRGARRPPDDPALTAQTPPRGTPRVPPPQAPTAYAGPQQPGAPVRRPPQAPPPAEPPARPGRRHAVEAPPDAPVTAVPLTAPFTAVPVNAPVTAVPLDRRAAPGRRRAPDDAPVDAPVTAVPFSSPPFTVPVSAPPVSGPPTSAPPAAPPGETTVPVADLPASAPPAAAHTGELASVRDASTVDDEPISVPPADAPTSAPPAPTGPDPEQILATYEWVFDSETLREVVEDREGLEEVRDMLTAKVNDHTDNATRARLLSLRAVVSRILGDLHKALADAKLALAHAEATGELRRIAICQARLAHVLQWRGEYAEADRLFAEANSTELPDRLRGTMHQHAGKCAYDQGRYIEACNHFERALDLRKQEDPDLMAATELALDAVFRKVMFNGWGPYPRSIEEIKQISRPPSPAMDDSTGLWGFTDAEGDTRIGAHYADIQPFRDGVAWVRRPEFETWELIDDAGATLIPAAGGYLGVSSFAGGLAWVSRDGNGGWIAVDKSNTVTISTGFDDVRPFRRGIAAVRRGGRWGAVDGVGRVIVPFAYDQFSTALSDGRYIDGFSDEGLAVVQVHGRKGVVDRAGRTLVDPAFTSLVIHPVAFLITDDGGAWGALDRKGRILIDPTHPSRVSVTMEIDRLLADARPVL